MTFFAAIVLIVVVAVAAYAGYSIGSRGRTRGDGSMNPDTPASVTVLNVPAPVPDRSPPAIAATTAAAAPEFAEERIEMERVGQEKARIIRSRDAEAAALRNDLADRDTRASTDLASARMESARYRQLVVAIENNAPPPILAGMGEPDDLKLIVGIGPVLERMLHNLGVTTFRQIARWSERDSAEFDAKLPEFPGRIVRDQWITQARELHLAKFGELPSDRPPRS